MKFLFVQLCIVLPLFCLFSLPAQAADYSITPLIVDHTIVARDSFEETIKISNTTDRPLRLFPTVNEITVGTEGSVETFVPASMSNTATSVTSWISITRARVEIAPGETIKVPLTIQVSPNAVPGEYHAFIGFAEGSKRDEAEARVLAGTAPGTVVRLSLVEKRSEYLRLERFAIDRFITSPDEAVVTYELQNVGGLPITPGGEIIFYNNNGEEQVAIPVNTAAKSIAPGATDTFTDTIPDLGVIGRHKAFLNIEYGANQRANLYDTVYFNIIPIKFLVIIFLVLLTLSILMSLYYHRTRRVVSKEEEEVSVYIRSGVTTAEKDHDINLKK
jgi:hypothetical protein